MRLLASRTLLIISIALWANSALAQSLPERTALRVNDYAELLDPAAEARITEKLNQVQSDIGTDVTVLTIDTRSDYGNSASIEAFATALFNQWGIGSVDNNTGILILVARNDREMRIELGADYPPIYDEISENVIDGAFLPAFREVRYQSGIETGVDRAIARIAAPFANGEEVRAEPDGGLSGSIVGLLAAGGLGFAGLMGMLIYRARRKCPQCGQQTLNRAKETLVNATRTNTGQGREDLDCPNCGFTKTSHYTIPMISDTHSSSSGGGSSGGGFSSGGGASGRW